MHAKQGVAWPALPSPTRIPASLSVPSQCLSHSHCVSLGPRCRLEAAGLADTYLTTHQLFQPWLETWEGDITAQLLQLERREGRRAELAELLAEAGLQYQLGSTPCQQYIAGQYTSACSVVRHLLGAAEAQQSRYQELQDRWGWANGIRSKCMG